jgi:hypothetical protein
MLDITGTVQDGVIRPDGPLGLPDGSKVRITSPGGSTDEPIRMMREEEWPTTPEGVAALLKRWEQHEPLVFTPDEEAERAAWRAEMKRLNIEAVRKQMGLPE